MMNTIKLIAFATIREAVGFKEHYLEIPEGIRVIDLKAILSTSYPDLTARLPTLITSINNEFAFDDDLIPAGAEVGLFPPVSGGDRDKFPVNIWIGQEKLDFFKFIEGIISPVTGAVVLFIGFVRGITNYQEERKTDYLIYEAYEPMARLKAMQVAYEIHDKWPQVEGVTIAQRIGKLLPGSPTVLIACSAAHRDSGVFDAARYGIDRLKEIVPIWKQEIGSDGIVWVEGDHVPTPEDKN